MRFSPFSYRYTRPLQIDVKLAQPRSQREAYAEGGGQSAARGGYGTQNYTGGGGAGAYGNQNYGGQAVGGAAGAGAGAGASAPLCSQEVIVILRGRRWMLGGRLDWVDVDVDAAGKKNEERGS